MAERPSTSSGDRMCHPLATETTSVTSFVAVLPAWIYQCVWQVQGPLLLTIRTNLLQSTDELVPSQGRHDRERKVLHVMLRRSPDTRCLRAHRLCEQALSLSRLSPPCLGNTIRSGVLTARRLRRPEQHRVPEPDHLRVLPFRGQRFGVLDC